MYIRFVSWTTSTRIGLPAVPWLQNIICVYIRFVSLDNKYQNRSTSSAMITKYHLCVHPLCITGQQVPEQVYQQCHDYKISFVCTSALYHWTTSTRIGLPAVPWLHNIICVYSTSALYHWTTSTRIGLPAVPWLQNIICVYIRFVSLDNKYQNRSTSSAMIT